MSTYINDFANSVRYVSGSDPAARTATFQGTGVDMILADGPCFGIQHVGAVSGTTPTLDGKFQEAIEDPATPGTPLASDYSDISGATFTQVTTSTNMQTKTFTRTKRFIRYVGTIAGTTPSFTMAVGIGELKKNL